MPKTGYGISNFTKIKNILLAILIMNVISTSNFNQADARSSQDIPRPEHPRPQLLRAEWLNLNGQWQFAETNDRNDESFLQDGNFPDSINVPFCRESKLSGLERRGFMKNVWYKRTFDAPKDWKSPRIRLHFNACDWHTRVWLNGEYLGEHTGGNAPFWFDITDEIQNKDNVITVHAFDDSASALQPLGKQSIREESYAIFYTRTTGIWQTVWLEGVGETFIRNLRISPDPDSSRILVHAELDGLTDGLTLEAIAKADGKEAGKASIQAKDNNHLVLDLSVSHLWSPQDPFLYDLVLNVRRTVNQSIH